MSKRRLRDYIQDAFFCRDKASVAKLIQDAEEAEGNGNGEHAEPDGDEGKHASNVHVHIEHKGSAGDGKTTDNDDDDTEKRLKNCEDGIKSLQGDMKKVLDAVTKTKDKDDDDDDDKKKTADADGDDDDDDDKKKKDTDDEDPDSGTSGATTAEALKGAEPDLMEADPSLKTGRSEMGDSAYAKKVHDAMALVAKDTLARAEVLSPGIRMPTIDSAKDGVRAAKRLCTFRRDALVGALATDNGRQAVGKYDGKAIRQMSCDAVRMLFNDASERMWDLNNASQGGRVDSSQFQHTMDIRTFRQKQEAVLQGINKRNREYYAQQSGRPN